MGVAQGAGTGALGGLGQPQFASGLRADDRSVPDPLDGIHERKHRDRRIGTGRDGLNHGLEQPWRGERPCGIVDDHDLGLGGRWP